MSTATSQASEAAERKAEANAIMLGCVLNVAFYAAVGWLLWKVLT